MNGQFAQQAQDARLHRLQPSVPILVSLLPMQFVLLWTDAAIFILVAGAAAYGAYVVRRPHLAEPWRQVRRRPAAMASLVVLLAYTSVGLLDSVHFRLRLPDAVPGQPAQYATEVLSLFDWLVRPLKEDVERTYSAPLAAYSHAKETVERPDGTTTRAFPRLTYGGAHLSNPATQWGLDIFVTTVTWAMLGLLAFGLFFGLPTLAVAQRRAASNDQSRPPADTTWPAVLMTAATLFVIGFIAAGISRHYHLLGTDKVGQDVFYLSLKSIRTGMVIGVLTTLISLPFAVGLGIAAGYFGRRIDDGIQYLYTTLSAIPGVLLIAASVLTLQAYMDRNADSFAGVTERADVRLFMLCLILGVTGWIGLCRLLRGETMKLREMDYVQAAVSIGAGHGRILARHILPNVMHLVLIAAVLDFSGLVLAEAVLSYVGVGVDPSMISWGNMINGARMEMAREPIVWWSLAAALIFMFSLVLPANLFADAVRDAFDPRLRGR